MKVNLVRIQEKTIQEAEISILGANIQAIKIIGPENPSLPYALPGFVDAHVHIESSMLTPVQFAKLAVVHGTVSTISDPHEIANVMGIEGVKYMIEDGKRVPFKFCFGAPSCVPATTFETAGATIDSNGVRELLKDADIGYLAEVMNFPGVIHEDPEIIAKLNWAKHYNKPIDGHAPGLRGEAAKIYASHGISTDHECYTYDEAFEKIGYGVKILIREGSAARNFDALIPLIAEFPEQIMFCSDDKHPDNLVEGHINLLVKRALDLGYNLWHILQAACVNPVKHYNLPVGQLQVGDRGDFIVVNNLNEFKVLETYLDGNLVAKDQVSLLPCLRSNHINQFNCLPKTPSEFAFKLDAEASQYRIIEALEGQLITHELLSEIPAGTFELASNTELDILKVTVVNRYSNQPPAVALIKNFGLKSGAIASSVAHDSHNIIAVGVDDESICKAVNLVIESKGGVSAVGPKEEMLLKLPIAGLMSDEDGYQISSQYTKLDTFVKVQLKSTLKSPYMTLSFMALLVIPSLKLSDKGLFNGDNFKYVTVTI